MALFSLAFELLLLSLPVYLFRIPGGFYMKHFQNQQGDLATLFNVLLITPEQSSAARKAQEFTLGRISTAFTVFCSNSHTSSQSVVWKMVRVNTLKT